MRPMKLALHSGLLLSECVERQRSLWWAFCIFFLCEQPSASLPRLQVIEDVKKGDVQTDLSLALAEQVLVPPTGTKRSSSLPQGPRCVQIVY